MLVHHLRYNHVPPLPLELVETAEQALDLVASGSSAEVQIPGGGHAPAADLVEALNLGDFVPMNTRVR